jgi:hypothetical protein
LACASACKHRNFNVPQSGAKAADLDSKAPSSLAKAGWEKDFDTGKKFVTKVFITKEFGALNFKNPEDDSQGLVFEKTESLVNFLEANSIPKIEMRDKLLISDTDGRKKILAKVAELEQLVDATFDVQKYGLYHIINRLKFDDRVYLPRRLAGLTVRVVSQNDDGQKSKFSAGWGKVILDIRSQNWGLKLSDDSERTTKQGDYFYVDWTDLYALEVDTSMAQLDSDLEVLDARISGRIMPSPSLNHLSNAIKKDFLARKAPAPR